MIALSVAEAKNSLSALLARVEAGEEFEITRRGRPVAVLKAANNKSREEHDDAAIRRRHLGGGGLSAAHASYALCKRCHAIAAAGFAMRSSGSASLGMRQYPVDTNETRPSDAATSRGSADVDRE